MLLLTLDAVNQLLKMEKVKSVFHDKMDSHWNENTLRFFPYSDEEHRGPIHNGITREEI